MWLDLSIIFCLYARKFYAFGGSGILSLVSVQFFHPPWKLTSGNIALRIESNNIRNLEDYLVCHSLEYIMS